MSISVCLFVCVCFCGCGFKAHFAQSLQLAAIRSTYAATRVAWHGGAQLLDLVG